MMVIMNDCGNKVYSRDCSKKSWPELERENPRWRVILIAQGQQGLIHGWYGGPTWLMVYSFTLSLSVYPL